MDKVTELVLRLGFPNLETAQGRDQFWIQFSESLCLQGVQQPAPAIQEAVLAYAFQRFSMRTKHELLKL